jgi:hypothetical protein
LTTKVKTTKGGTTAEGGTITMKKIQRRDGEMTTSRTIGLDFVEDDDNNKESCKGRFLGVRGF